MRFTWLHLVLAAMGGLMVGALGFSRVGSPEPASPAAAQGSHRPEPRSVRPDRSQPSGLRRKIRSASERDLPQLAYQALEVRDASERREALLEAIRATSDPATCIEIIDQFHRITRESGRSHGPLLSAALFEAGKLYRTAMLDSWKGMEPPPPDHYLWETLYGASFADPLSANQWLSQAEPNLRASLVSALIGGAALYDPDQASALIAALPEDEQSRCTSDFINNTIQSQGLDRAVDWMLEVSGSRTGDAKYVEVARHAVFAKLATTANDNGGDEQLVRRLEHIHQAAPISSRDIMQIVGKLPGSTSLSVLDQLAEGPVFTQSAEPDALDSVVQFAIARSADSARNWLEDHPDSPLAPALRAHLDP